MEQEGWLWLPYVRGDWLFDDPILRKIDTDTREYFKRINPECDITFFEQGTVHVTDSTCVDSTDYTHVDNGREKNVWSALWYIQGDGDTIIYNDQLDWEYLQRADNDMTRDKAINSWSPYHVSSPEPGKVLIFPSNMMHRPGFCTSGKRIVINTLYHIPNLLDNYNESLSIASVPE